MLKTSERLLQILSLLQVRPFWPGRALAERLEVSTRTIRADVERLRELGYPIQSTPGVAGGYQLGAGAALPPLLLDDDEAIAVALGLSTAAADGSIADLEEASLRALAKMYQVLPSHLRHRISTVQSTVVPVPAHGPAVEPDVLLTLASACRDAVQLRFDYRTHSDTASRRIVEPYRLALRAGRWYLLAFDLERDDWRTFRVDRLTPRIPMGRRFTPRELPAEGAADHVDRGVASAPWGFRASVVIHAPAAVVAERLPRAAGVVTARDEESCVLESGSDDPAALLRYLSMLDLDFSVADDPALAAEARRLAERFARAAGA
ncbi:YafY family protein [Microbacterium sp. W4I20]|uniref:helix-turn-helix transcriptional regulator n=1 Tax=Microbacterium sp. W4I20 TaxID=3042262 RepID=UPI00277DE1C6|nr:YafY family protein [Microbacterium sp. W4I20]MDQ0727845.1 putative DNA-binding transcriptional regulator YafY [Microbacterium sp. W4I20]